MSVVDFALTDMECQDYQSVFLNDSALIDVRAPVEYRQGAFPNAMNVPLLMDDERASVGTCYKKHGKQSAIALGESLVSGALREQRVAAWASLCRANPDGYIYCFRGGLRSHIVQQWLHEAGIDYPLIKGGYKALRRYLITLIQQVSGQPIVLLGGNTGSGKTQLVRQLNHGIDLEGVACHRGSSFGRTLQPQSGQIDFENRLAIKLLRQKQAGITAWVIEDEGKNIGSNHLPFELYQAMQNAPIAVIDDPFELRVQRLKQEYIDSMYQQFVITYGVEEGQKQFTDYLHHGLYAIRKRLGSERYIALMQSMDDALSAQFNERGSEQHLGWLIPLLHHYYDPMYHYQLSKKAARIIFRGSYPEVSEYLLTLHR